jgi:hypothetical protein
VALTIAFQSSASLIKPAVLADKTHKMKNKLFCALAGLMALSAVPASAGSIYSVFYDNRFGVIDSSTGAYTQIGTLPIAQSAGIASFNNILFAQSMQSELVSIDPASGTSSVIGDSGLQLSSVGFAGGYNGLFEVDSMSNLYSINPDTGAAALVGATGLAANYGDWDTSLSDSGTNLYFTAGGGGAIDQLYEINPTTGVATDLGSTGVTRIAGSAIVSGYLDLFQYNAGTDYIYSAPLGSTNFTAVAVLGTQIVDGGTVLGSSATNNTSTVPEPFSILLMSSSVLGLGLWARRSARTRACRVETDLDTSL